MDRPGRRGGERWRATSTRSGSPCSTCPEGRGPTGTAARERDHVFTTDIAKDARMGPWREAALAREYRSSAAFPLVIEDRCVAVVTAYSSELGFFDEEEVALFDRMASDLSFALEAMAREERRRAVEAELRASEERFRVAAESMLDSLTILSPVRDAAVRSSTFECGTSTTRTAQLVGPGTRAGDWPSARRAVSRISRQ